MLHKECSDLQLTLESVREERQQLRQLLALSALEAAVTTEREACALLVEEWAAAQGFVGERGLIPKSIAAYIRKRGRNS